MNSRVSIIIPVFNAESTLSRCLDSIISQSFLCWELILVNDGSDDNSMKVCEDYATKDQRISVYHKEHGGCSSARNYGLSVAKSPTIVFADADDYVGEFWLEHLMLEESADLVVTGYVIHRGGQVYESLPEVVNSIPDLIGSLGASLTLGWSCRLRFDRKCIADHFIRFNEDYQVLEDECFVSEYLKYAKTVAVNPVADYHYLVDDNINKYQEKWNDDVYFEISNNIFLVLDSDQVNFSKKSQIRQVKHYYLVAMHESFLRECKKGIPNKSGNYYLSLSQFSNNWVIYPKVLLFQKWIYPLLKLILPYF